MTTTDRNYWMDTVSMPAGSPGPPPARADVAVIGAGYTGLSAAHELATRGTAVIVLEARSIGWGASSRNGGMVLTGLKVGHEALRSRYGGDAAREMDAAALASIEHTDSLIRAARIDCDFTRCGHLEVACTPSQYTRLARATEIGSGEADPRRRVVPRDELSTELGSTAYFGGIVDDRSGGLNPARFVAGLARATLAAGANVYDRTRATRITRAGHDGQQGYDIVTADRRIFARDVVIATGGYTNGAVPALRRRIVPIGSYIIATAPLPDAMARELSPRRRMIFDSRHFLHYYRLTPDNRMLFGGRAAFLPASRRTIARSAAILRRDLVGVFPQLQGTAIDYVWGGTLDFCFDTLPHAGRLDGMYYSVGYAGHGVAMATYLGAQVAAQLCGERTQNPFADIPFPGAPLGLHGAVRWGLPIVAGWYKLRDWIDR
jgi:glycine/D-amino acid oxidase-like deaminating enzyme